MTSKELDHDLSDCKDNTTEIVPGHIEVVVCASPITRILGRAMWSDQTDSYRIVAEAYTALSLGDITYIASVLRTLSDETQEQSE